MASTNLDRTAVVKIALFGSVNLKEGMQDISKQLHDFSYSVVDDGNGSQSYKFKIELVNTDESFLKSIVHAYSSILGNKSGLVTQDDVLQSFPKLLIQWGYNNALSKIHTAQLSNLTYKFTQGKEKIIVIEAVNVGDWAAEFFRKAATTTNVYSLHTARRSFGESSISDMALSKTADGNQKMNVAQVLMDMMTSLLLTINGVKATHELGYDEGGIVAETNIILNYIQDELIKEEGPIAFDSSRDNLHVQKLQAKRAEEQPHKTSYSAIKTFFKHFGIEVVNRTDQINIKRQKYLPIQEFIPKDDNGVHGILTKEAWIPLSQLKDSSKVGNLEPPLERKAKSEIMLPFNQASSESWSNNADNAIAIYNSRNPLNPISSASVIFKVNIQEQEQNKLKAGGRGNGYIMQATGVDSMGKTINILPYVNYKSISVFGTDTQAGGVSSRDYLRSLDLGVQQDKEDQNVNDTFTTEQREKYDVNKVDNERAVRYTELDYQERLRLQYTNMEFTLTSPEGYSTLDTVKDIIKKFNLMVSNAANRVSMTEDSVVAPGDSFIKVWEELNEKPKNINTTVFRIKSGATASNKERASLPDIESFPHINYTPSAGIVEMSYGEANSIVKYFDFNGDLRVLTHILGAVALEQSLRNEYEYLNTESLRATVLPTLQVLIDDENFLEYLEGDDSIDGKRLVEDIKALAQQINASSPIALNQANGISSKFFQDTGYITKYIESGNFRQRLREADNTEGAQLIVNLAGDGEDVSDDSNFNNTIRFLKSIAQSEGIKSLFNQVDITAYKTGNSTIINYGKVIAGEPIEEEKEVDRAYVYTLVGNNVFDHYIDSKVAQGKRGLLSPNAANIAMDTYFKHGAENWEIKIKTLGIPEMDTLNEISAPRLFKFNVHDLSSEKPLEIGDPTNTHWLSGVYQPLAITHKINKNGYVSEFKLFKNMRIG